MNFKKTVTVLYVALIMALCTPAAKLLPTETAMPTQTFTLVVPTPTATWWMTPQITATPLNTTINTDEEMLSVIQRTHPNECISSNDVNPESPSSLKFNEIDELPDPNIYYVEEIAVNADNSRQAVVACKPDKCEDYVYVKDNTTDETYQIDWGGRISWRPIQRLIWINQDILMFDQSSNPHYGAIIAINIAQKEFQFFGISSDGCSQSTPTP